MTGTFLLPLVLKRRPLLKKRILDEEPISEKPKEGESEVVREKEKSAEDEVREMGTSDWPKIEPTSSSSSSLKKKKKKRERKKRKNTPVVLSWDYLPEVEQFLWVVIINLVLSILLLFPLSAQWVSQKRYIYFFLNYAVATRDLAHSSVYPCMSDFAEISWFSHHLWGVLWLYVTKSFNEFYRWENSEECLKKRRKKKKS